MGRILIGSGIISGTTMASNLDERWHWGLAFVCDLPFRIWFWMCSRPFLQHFHVTQPVPNPETPQNPPRTHQEPTKRSAIASENRIILYTNTIPPTRSLQRKQPQKATQSRQTRFRSLPALFVH